MASVSKFRRLVQEHNDLFTNLSKIEKDIDDALVLLIGSLSSGNKILVCGNGGSAADSQHFAAELIGRFELERRSLPAIALTTDTSALTAIGNDYGFSSVFARQLEGLGNKADTLVGISTSGNSKNVILAVEAAKKKGIHTIGVLGNDGGELASLVDVPVIVPHSVTARIQEAHIFIIHFWCARIERELFSSSSND